MAVFHKDEMPTFRAVAIDGAKSLKALECAVIRHTKYGLSRSAGDVLRLGLACYLKYTQSADVHYVNFINAKKKSPSMQCTN